MRTLTLLLSILVLVGCSPVVRKPEGEAMSVRFTYRDTSASSVSIAGSFNQWEPKRHALRGPDADGIWTIVLSLPSGRYEYRFAVNGSEWVLDPGAPSVDDGMGGLNSQVIVEP